MKSDPWLRTLVAAIALVGAMTVRAQTTAGAGSVVVIPLVSHSTSFDSEIFVRNDQNTAITLNVRFYDRTNPPPPGLRACNQLTVPGNLTVSFTLVSQCTLNPLNGYSGMLVLEDATRDVQNQFLLRYDRTQNPSGIGLSVEGFPVGNFSGQNANVIGLKRVAAAPGYQSNCFVAALGEPVDYTVELFDIYEHSDRQYAVGIAGALSDGAISGHLRGRGAAPGDNLDARARFSSTDTDPNAPALAGYCTVQENNTFGADFRIAKSRDGLDRRQKRIMCYATDPADSDLPDHRPGVADADPVDGPAEYPLAVFSPTRFRQVRPSQLALGGSGDAAAFADDVHNGNAVFVPSAPYDANPPYRPVGRGLPASISLPGTAVEVGQGSGVARSRAGSSTFNPARGRREFRRFPSGLRDRLYRRQRGQRPVGASAGEQVGFLRPLRAA